MLRVPVALVRATGARATANVVNIGLGGACIEIGEAIEQGERVAIDVTAPSLWDPLRVKARVAWAAAVPGSRQSMRAGLAFEHAEPLDVLALFQLISDAVF